MTAADAGRRLGISPRTVIKMLRDDAVKRGREWMIATPAVREFERARWSKRCPWCGQPAKIGSHYVTCGGQVCIRRQRQVASQAKAKKMVKPDMKRLAMTGDGLGRRRIRDAVEGRVSGGMDLQSAVFEVAVQEREKPAVVLSVWRSR
jgi:hypothetical protein